MVNLPCALLWMRPCTYGCDNLPVYSTIVSTPRDDTVDPVLNVKGQNRAVLLSSGSITRTCAVKMSPALALP